MIEEIRKELQRLEGQHEIKILYAVESGSRAWGFASTDSDWDVRYIYVHNLDWYLKIDDKKDSQEEILPNDLDLSGWELKKALRLFRKSNPPMLEWLRSPIIYKETTSTAERMRELTGEYFNPRSCIHHYLHMADGNFKTYLQKDSVRTKKYFYVLRPILACDWIRRTGTIPPVEFRNLLDTPILNATIITEIENLLVRKMSGEELNEEPQIPVLQIFLEQQLEFYKEYVRSVELPPMPKTDLLNSLFNKVYLRHGYESGLIRKCTDNKNSEEQIGHLTHNAPYDF